MFSSDNKPFQHCCSKLNYVIIIRNIKSEYISQVVVGKVSKNHSKDWTTSRLLSKHNKTITNYLHNKWIETQKKKLLELVLRFPLI